MATQYDKIARRYKKSLKNIQREYSLVPSFFRYLGNLKNRKVLDLACGEGFFSRLIKKRGALEVVGIDKSQKMLNLAKEEENKNPLGIKYKKYDARKLPKLENFDLISAAFLLCYAKTKLELLAMCKNIYKNLKESGKFVTLNNNPFNPLQLHKKYDFTITSKKPLNEGNPLTVTLFVNNLETCSFRNYFWKWETYERALKVTGFKKIKWHNAIISPVAIKKFGNKFWEDYRKQPGIIIIEATK